MRWLVYILFPIGAAALDYGFLVQMASLLAHTRKVDSALIEKMVRTEGAHRQRLIPGIAAIICAFLFFGSAVDALTYFLLSAVCLIGYLALQTVAFMNVARKLPKPSL
jgi:hypothetical protein